ncbi:dephospho-CoA kinase [Dorcoceras hygrometricum]|uniref:Dephospho-CoA kinase n=1 Tax=Dorcoceras hygrometricum TaxID=472368 RepID=A0A2Z7ATU7_9LAMI|nr:dephospho-CoA kinase [Dorcoceras hygrometricum]
MSLELKRTKADLVIYNTGRLEQLSDDVREVLMHGKKPLTWTEMNLGFPGMELLFLLVSSNVTFKAL